MTSSQNSIDTATGQSTDHNSCAKCSEQFSHLFTLSCVHEICMECMETLIDENKYTQCPTCHNVLTKTLHQIYSDFLGNPLAKLSCYHDIRVGDELWYYGGNGHNWLYSKDQCVIINNAYDEYENDDGATKVELQIQMGNIVQTCIIDFDTDTQYLKTSPNKKRPISHFEFTDLSDFENNKIVGIAGKKFV